MEEEERERVGGAEGHRGVRVREESGGRQTAFTLDHTLGGAVLGSPVLDTRCHSPLQGPGHLCCACRPRAV